MFIPLLLMLVSGGWAEPIPLVSSTWNVTFNPANPTVLVGETKTIAFNLTGVANTNKYILTIGTTNPNLLDVDFNEIPLSSIDDEYSGYFNITGIFLGKTEVVLKIKHNINNDVVWEQAATVKILRPQRTLDKVFSISVAVLVSLIYINFGCALSWQDVKQTLRKPIGPGILLISQFIFMPLASYGLGLILFPNDANMQLGMFFTGVAPSGGASNMWTLLLAGNLNLSITMTACSTIAAFATMPLWLFSLGRVIFHHGNIPVPYSQISTYAIALVIPLLIGYLIQKYLKSIGHFLAKILKGFASALLIFIIVFAIVVNYYLFRLFSWKLILAGLGLPWVGYGFGWSFSKYVCRQNSKDSLTIAIETGIQNTGIAIFMLRYTLPQPEADITTIVPVCVATMTPIPLLVLYIIQRFKNRKTMEPSSNSIQAEDQNQSYQSIRE